MQDSITTSLATASLALVLVGLLSLPAASQCFQRCTASKSQFEDLLDRYEDEDGIASEESQAAYSDFVPRLILILVSIVGTVDCLISSILVTTHAAVPLVVEQWLQFATWVR
jgi:hypothetical protein